MSTSRIVYCVKLKKQAEGLDFPPYPGELGAKVYANISKEAWQLWLALQTKYINERRLTMTDPNARQFLANEMETFLFTENASTPVGIAPPTSS